MKTLIVIDIETTGLYPDDACIWEIGAVAVREGALVAEFSSRVQPLLAHFQAEHRGVCQRVSGLSDAELLSLLDEPDSATVSRRLLEWIIGPAGVRPPQFLYAAYNVDFDGGFLALAPWGISAPDAWAPCLMKRAQAAMGLRRWPKLGAACQHFGVPYAGTHQALDDARAAAQLYLALEKVAVPACL